MPIVDITDDQSTEAKQEHNINSLATRISAHLASCFWVNADSHPSATKKVKNKHDEGDHDEDMDESAGDVKNETADPEQQ